MWAFATNLYSKVYLYSLPISFWMVTRAFWRYMMAFSSCIEPLGMFAYCHAVCTSFSYLLILALEMFSVEGFIFLIISACVFCNLAK